MSKIKKSAKQVQIDKANLKIVVLVSVAAIVTSFSLVGSKSLLDQYTYNTRVIKEQKKALVIADKDVVAAKQLESRYNAFNDASLNIIKGSRDGATAQDGANSKIVLDALPSKYDFPALVSSLEKILKDRGFKIDSLSGTDDLSLADTADSANPVAVEIPFQFTVSGSYASIQELVAVLDKSIRPLSISSIELSGSEQKISMVVSAKTYYQPGKTVKIESKVVK